ncbi:MAG TPA: tripartite tricarboxylate transporter substrate binding protein, partial [Burkholderiales bacterium]|nr:tripartite tricarboxylate transporter substrate binding protein [Burkholderiales bacterium]
MSKALATAGLMILLAGHSHAQNPAAAPYPTRAVRLISPVASGGTTADVVARAVAKKLNEAWGQPVVVDPRP